MTNTKNRTYNKTLCWFFRYWSDKKGKYRILKNQTQNVLKELRPVLTWVRNFQQILYDPQTPQNETAEPKKQKALKRRVDVAVQSISSSQTSSEPSCDEIIPSDSALENTMLAASQIFEDVNNVIEINSTDWKVEAVVKNMPNHSQNKVKIYFWLLVESILFLTKSSLWLTTAPSYFYQKGVAITNIFPLIKIASSRFSKLNRVNKKILFILDFYFKQWLMQIVAAVIKTIICNTNVFNYSHEMGANSWDVAYAGPLFSKLFQEANVFSFFNENALNLSYKVFFVTEGWKNNIQAKKSFDVCWKELFLCKFSEPLWWPACICQTVTTQHHLIYNFYIFKNNICTLWELKPLININNTVSLNGCNELSDLASSDYLDYQQFTQCKQFNALKSNIVD